MARLLRSRAPRIRATIAEGWVRPFWLERAGGGGSANEQQRRWTVLGNLGSPGRARVDLRGLVTVDGRAWSLDWWIGAEDRWHVPAHETGVRQSVLGATPVVETRVRIPGGDAIQRVYAARDAAGVDAVVVEIENATTVPFAVALSLRPYGPEGVGGVREVAVDGTELFVDGRLAALLPSVPRHAVAGTADGGDAGAAVFDGTATGAPPAGARCREGLATLAVLHPLAHTATLRVVVPLGERRPDPASLPDVASVVSGWQAHARTGTRIEVPDRRLQGAVDASIRHLLLRPAGLASAAALDRCGFDDLAAPALRDEIALLSSIDPSAALAAVVEHWSVERDAALAAALAPTVAALVSSLSRASDRHERRRGAGRLPVAAELLEAAGEGRAAADVRATAAALDEPTRPTDVGPSAELAVADAAVVGAGGDPSPLATLQRARAELLDGRAATAQARLSWVLGAASGTWTWPTSIPAADSIGGLGDGHDPAVNAALVQLVRDLLVADVDGGLALSPVVPDAWLGQGWALHDAPTVHGRMSFAVRWHGDRPALLWELEPPPGRPPVRLTAPVLDPTWSSDDPRGEALLAPVAMPERAPRRGLSIPVSIEPTPRGPR